jgi:hypothetical protein
VYLAAVRLWAWDWAWRAAQWCGVCERERLVQRGVEDDWLRFQNSDKPNKDSDVTKPAHAHHHNTPDARIYPPPPTAAPNFLLHLCAPSSSTPCINAAHFTCRSCLAAAPAALVAPLSAAHQSSPDLTTTTTSPRHRLHPRTTIPPTLVLCAALDIKSIVIVGNIARRYRCRWASAGQTTKGLPSQSLQLAVTALSYHNSPLHLLSRRSLASQRA